MTTAASSEAASFDTYNARDRTATQVASSFIPPPMFDTLCRPGNALIIGPRGSGKTTLLKMLTPEAWAAWRHEDALRLRQQAAFSGIFVPIDVQLSDQLDSIHTSELPREINEEAISTVYGLHVFRCLVEHVAWLCQYDVDERWTRRAEAGLVTELSRLFGVPADIPLLDTLLAELRIRQVEALTAWRRCRIEFRSTGKLLHSELVILEFDTALKGAIDACIRHLQLLPSPTQKWVVLFDEVEGAPEPLQRQLLSYLRQSDTNLAFKMAVSPYLQSYMGLGEKVMASALNDYVVLDLSSYDDKQLETFTRQFFRAAAAARQAPAVDFDAMLGPAILSPGQRRGGRRANAREAVHELQQAEAILSLARKDSSFSAYLEKHVDVAASTDHAVDPRAPFRKVRQIALIRDAYLSERGVGSGKDLVRIKAKNDARKLYTGAGALVKICDGNPRRLAFVSSMMLDGMSEDGTVPLGVQALAIEKAEVAFRSFLRGLKVSEGAGRALPRGVLSFIDMLGAHYHRELVARDFDDDPHGSFVVDSSNSGVLEEVVSRALNAGALVQVSDDDERGALRTSDRAEPISTTRGKRFRLAYVLAPGYGVMLRLGRRQSLRQALGQVTDFGETRDRKIASALLNAQQTIW